MIEQKAGIIKNIGYPPITHDYEIEPSRSAYKRFHARIEWEPEDSFNPQQLGAIAKVIDAFRVAGVPNDAYVQVAWPTSWANWERPI